MNKNPKPQKFDELSFFVAIIIASVVVWYFVMGYCGLDYALGMPVALIGSFLAVVGMIVKKKLLVLIIPIGVYLQVTGNWGWHWLVGFSLSTPMFVIWIGAYLAKSVYAESVRYRRPGSLRARR